MGNWRLAQISTSDEGDEPSVPPDRKFLQQRTSASEENQPLSLRKRKKVKLPDNDDDDNLDHEDRDKLHNKKAKNDRANDKENHPSNIAAEEEDAQPLEDAMPIGEPVKVTGKGRYRRTHYESFEFDGNQYELEDPVLLVPEEKEQKPYVAIIKDISQTKDGSVMVTGQWFYRPEEADRRSGSGWRSCDTRELFYSFHRDEVPAESVMHKCVVHFVPQHKQLPNRKQDPGFIVQKVYDTDEKKLWKLTDKDYQDSKQHEIDLLVQKTMSHLVDLPDIETEEKPGSLVDQEDQLKNEKGFWRTNISPLDVSRNDEAGRPDQLQNPETPGSCPTNTSEYYCILANFDELTGENHRDKWRKKLLQGIQYMCSSSDSVKKGEKGEQSYGVVNGNANRKLEALNGCTENLEKVDQSFKWPDSAVRAVAALEKAAHDALSSDFQKYNQKLRQLEFNLKSNVLLSQRLLNGELEPSTIVNMSPKELKEGLTAEELAKIEPDDQQQMQMTDARCSRCSECQVGLRDIIQAGHGDRYQLECMACGHSWYASRDEAAVLTVDASNSSKSVGTAPWATAKFEEVEKRLVNPRKPDKSAAELYKKASEPYIPVLESKKSFGKSKRYDNIAAAKKVD